MTILIRFWACDMQILLNADELRRLKSAIASLTKEPFWDVGDSDIMQEMTSNYLLNGLDVAGSSIAEACERDRALASFVPSSFSGSTLGLVKNGVSIEGSKSIRSDRI